MILAQSIIHITAPKGLASFLRNEVTALGYTITWSGSGGLEIGGTLVDAMRLNLHLRTAHHVLFMLGRWTCHNPDELYREVNRLPWEEIIAADGYVSVVSNVVNPTIRDTRFANMRCKDAIVDRISSRKGRRPDSGPDRSRAVVSLFWRDERCVLYLDTSGESLSRRAYRRIPLEAPMQETLAAGVILSTGWVGDSNFVNPMCGSGTLAIEAAMIGTGRPAGFVRQNFGFMHTLLYDKTAWEKLHNDARKEIRKSTFSKLIATDIDAVSVDAARKNAQTAGVDDLIEFSQCDFRITRVPTDGGGVVVLNPEYGIRMGAETELEQTYRTIGDFLKKSCQGYRAYVFTANTKLAGNIGMKSRRHIEFFSGKIACRLYQYEIFPARVHSDRAGESPDTEASEQ